MKKSGIIAACFLVSLFFFGGMASSAQQASQTGSIQIPADEARFTQMAKISMSSAISAALKQFPGKVLQAKLENENGYLVYGVEIVKPDRQMVDVKVDAGNGVVLKADSDSNDAEDKEEGGGGHNQEMEE